MAKSGTITPTGADPTLAAAAVKTVIPQMTLGSLVAAILAAASEEVVAVVSFTDRTVDAFKGAGAATADGLMGSATLREQLTPDDATKRVSAWTPALSSTEGAAIATPVKPAFSVASLLNAIEDSLGTNPDDVHAIVDQVAGKVWLVTNSHLPDFATPDETFTQEVTTSSVTPKLAFE